MPTERRKIQNRINQRRYRMQIKNRIQMLEKAIIDSGVAAGLDLGFSKPTAIENDGESSGRQSFSTPASETDIGLDLDLQNLSSFDFDPSPDSLDESNFFASQDFFECWNQQDLGLDQETSPLPFMHDPNQQLQLSDSGSSGYSHRLISPWREVSTSESQSDILGSQLRAGSIETATSASNASKEPLHSTQIRGQAKKISLTENGKEAKKSRTGQRKARDPKEKIIASLREENKRLKELSTALVTMYDCTAKPTTAGEEVPQCHNLHATVKKLITRSFSIDNSDSVQLSNGNLEIDKPYHHDVSGRGTEQSCSPSEMGHVQMSMQDLEFSEMCAELTGCFDQEAGLQSLTSPGVWDSHPDHPSTIGDSSIANYPTTRKTRHSQASQARTSANYHGTNQQPFNTPIFTSMPLPNQQPLNSSLLTSLPLPSSHAYLEPTFSRRLVRLLWEYAFCVLTGPDIPQAHLNRVFGFCLRHRSKEILIKKFRAYLGLRQDPVSALDRQAWNTAPDKRDSRDEAGDEWDYWLEAGKVEDYLESLGFSLAGTEDKGTLDFAPVTSQNTQLSENSGISSSSPSTSSTSDEIQAQSVPAAPQVPYGSKWQPNSCITNTLFDENGNFHVPASWLTPSASEAAETPENSTCLNAERLMQRESGCYLDVNRFFAGLIDVSVCLGRAAGFRRVDVDAVLKRSMVKL